MSGVTPDLSLPFVHAPRLFLSVFLTAGAIKLMDDALDVERDRALGYDNWAARLGRATTAYALLLALLGAASDLRVALVLFLSAYALGMGREPGERLPSGVPAVVEMVIAGLLAIYLGGVSLTVAAGSQLWAIQLLDDWLDRAEDGRGGAGPEGSPSGGVARPEGGSNGGAAINDANGGSTWLRLATVVLLTLVGLALYFWLSIACILAATVIWTLGRKREVQEG